jgi:hypothetical protein
VFAAYGSYTRKKELIRSIGYNQTETTQKIGVFDSRLSSVLFGMGSRETISYQVKIEGQCTCKAIERRCSSSLSLKPKKNEILQRLQKKIIKMGRENTKKGEIKTRTEDGTNIKKSVCSNVFLCWKQPSVNISVKT